MQNLKLQPAGADSMDPTEFLPHLKHLLCLKKSQITLFIGAGSSVKKPIKSSITLLFHKGRVTNDSLEELKKPILLI